MIIEKNKVVSLTYTLRKDESAGEILETCDTTRPLEFVYDSGVMLPHFEKNITGLKIGSNFEFTLTSQEAYGEIIEDAIVDVSKDIFIVDGVLRDDLLQVGKFIPMRDNSGNPLNGKIIEVNDGDNVVVIDFNHPLAGQKLYFTGKIESIREATEDELSFGLHGKGGCGCGSGGCNSGGCGDNEGDCCSETENSNCGSGSCGCGSH